MECKLDKISVYYEEYGEGKPILIVHGFTPDHRLMSGCMEPIFEKKAGYRRVYPDLPGMGRTKGEDWIESTDQVLDILIDFIHQVIPEGNFILAGESYGGYLVRGIAARMRERVDGILFLCPMIVSDNAKRVVPEFKVIARDEKLLARLEEDDGFLSINVVQTEEVWKRYMEEVDSGLNMADRGFLDRLFHHAYGFSFDVDALLGRFEKSVLFLMGKQDNVVGYHDAYKLIENYPRATYALLDRAGHNLQIEQPGLFNCLVVEWLDRVEEYSKQHSAG